MQDLGVLAGFTSSSASAINSSDEVVGGSSNGSTTHAFVYTPSGGMVDLNSLIPAGSGWTLNSAEGVNDSGEITGSGTFNGVTEAFILILTPEPSTVALLGIGAIGFGAIAIRRRMRKQPA